MYLAYAAALLVAAASPHIRTLRQLHVQTAHPLGLRSWQTMSQTR
jgi:hypothetical protein